MQKHSWWHLFQTKLLFFQTIESAKCIFAMRAGSGKPAFLHALFLENKHQNSNVTCRNLAHLGAKKNRPKKSLTLVNISYAGAPSIHIELENAWDIYNQ